MNLVYMYIDKKETAEYYKIYPRQISVMSHPYYGKWFINTKGTDMFCSMAPEKFVRIVTDSGNLRHIMNAYNNYGAGNPYPVFETEEDCKAAVRLLHIYLYNRDYN